MSRRVVGLLALVALAVGVLAGALAFGDESPPADPDSSAEATTQRVSFQADGAAPAQTVLDLGGLTLRAYCRDVSRDRAYLLVTAETAFDDSIIAVSFGQKKGEQQLAYTFGLSDFDRSYGEYDFLGNDPDNTSGTLNYSRPDGGQLALTFVADERTAQGECVFGGPAVFTPTANPTTTTSEASEEDQVVLQDGLKRCPYMHRGEPPDVSGWSGSVRGVSCGKAGKLISNNFNDFFRGLTSRGLSTSDSEAIQNSDPSMFESAGFNCAAFPLPGGGGWHMICGKEDQEIAFYVTP